VIAATEAAMKVYGYCRVGTAEQVNSGLSLNSSRQCKIERWHLYMRQIYNMALNKSSGAARLLDQLQRDVSAHGYCFFQLVNDDKRPA
jgi:DNA invertase Pin-like site-specific DNA recombinase